MQSWHADGIVRIQFAGCRQTENQALPVNWCEIALALLDPPTEGVSGKMGEQTAQAGVQTAGLQRSETNQMSGTKTSETERPL
jgi:hypothetical protein